VLLGSYETAVCKVVLADALFSQMTRHAPTKNFNMIVSRDEHDKTI
jgi:hypothetical protein